MPTVEVIGIGLGLKDLTASHLELIRQAEVLVGGSRHLELFPELQVEKIRITGDIPAVCREIARCMDHKNVVVLASGDPLFYGIGSVLLDRLDRDRLRIHPNITSVAAAFARIKEPWSGAGLVSLHGQGGALNFTDQLASRDVCAVLTDRTRTPAWLAARLLEEDLQDFQMCVLEQLGTPRERITWYEPREAAEKEFLDPNIVVLKRRAVAKPDVHPFVPGMPDDWFVHSQGLITKSEVRAVTLSKLWLLPKCTVWDLGAGCGSVGIEAALAVAPGRVLAVEKNVTRIEEIRTNKERFQRTNLDIVQADLPEGLKQLPQPDRIFIGGGGEKLSRIIAEAGSCLQQAGIMVVNTVLLENVQAAGEKMREIGLRTELVQVQISRGKDMPWGHRLQAQNPVWVISGRKKA